LVLAPLVPGIALELVVEPLGMLFAMVAAFLWLVTSIYAIGYMRVHHEENQARFYACFAIAIGSTMGVAFADNLVTLFVFYEALTLSTYPLVTHAGTPEARRAGRVYLGTLLGTSIGFQLLAIAWTYAYAGTVDFRAGGILSGMRGVWPRWCSACSRSASARPHSCCSTAGFRWQREPYPGSNVCDSHGLGW